MFDCFMKWNEKKGVKMISYESLKFYKKKKKKNKCKENSEEFEQIRVCLTWRMSNTFYRFLKEIWTFEVCTLEIFPSNCFWRLMGNFFIECCLRSSAYFLIIYFFFYFLVFFKETSESILLLSYSTFYLINKLTPHIFISLLLLLRKQQLK